MVRWHYTGDMRCCLFGLVLAACASPAAGGWRGTADLGPVAAYDIEYKLSDDASQGQIAIREPGRGFSQQWFRLCTLSVDRRQMRATYDPTSPDCQGAVGNRREIRGLVGESVLWGEIWQGNQKQGFFRAFHLPLPDAASATEP